MVKTPTRVFVFPVKGREAEVAKLKQMLVAAGCELVCDHRVIGDYEKCLKEAGVLVILMCPETDGDETVTGLITLATSLGKRVIGVWLPGSTATELPAAINKHGDAGITMDAKMIEEVVCGSKTAWVLPDGKPRPAPKTPRHKG
jgi:hypothetical protein